MVAFLLAGGGVAATAVLGALALRQGLLAAYVLAAAEVVGASELLSFLNAIGVAVILHVAIGRRWPFGGQRSREAA